MCSATREESRTTLNSDSVSKARQGDCINYDFYKFIVIKSKQNAFNEAIAFNGGNDYISRFYFKLNHSNRAKLLVANLFLSGGQLMIAQLTTTKIDAICKPARRCQDYNDCVRKILILFLLHQGHINARNLILKVHQFPSHEFRQLKSEIFFSLMPYFYFFVDCTKTSLFYLQQCHYASFMNSCTRIICNCLGTRILSGIDLLRWVHSFEIKVAKNCNLSDRRVNERFCRHCDDYAKTKICKKEGFDHCNKN